MLSTSTTGSFGAAPATPHAPTLASAYSQVGKRLIPVLMVLYLIAFLDRVNTSFAALTMNADLRISDSLFGLGAGIFFVGYFVFELPSNFMLARVGARLWIAFIMVIWGALSAALAFVHNGPEYLLLRFLIGAAEAGFFPGVVLYLTYWLPRSVRAHYLARFIVAIPLSTVIGAPLSVQILGLNGRAGLHGWQWLFLLEGLLAVFVGLLVPLLLVNGPAQAAWLSTQQRSALSAAIAAEEEPGSAHPAWLSLLGSPMVLVLIAAYFALTIGLYGLGFWMPRILTAEGVKPMQLGWIAAIPYLAAAAGMTAWCKRADRTGHRAQHLAGAFVCAALGVLLGSVHHQLALSVVGFGFAALGIFTAMPLFWAHATLVLRHGTAVVAGIAIINSIGNFGGFAGPVAMGMMLERTHSYSLGLSSVSLALVAGAALIWWSTRLASRLPT